MLAFRQDLGGCSDEDCFKEPLLDIYMLRWSKKETLMALAAENMEWNSHATSILARIDDSHQKHQEDKRH
ncbi:hypothetical protein MRB53_042047 [Persea americana]|nr:hypothetical protein MRB53_042047 [Persea americana]